MRGRSGQEEEVQWPTQNKTGVADTSAAPEPAWSSHAVLGRAAAALLLTPPLCTLLPGPHQQACGFRAEIQLVIWRVDPGRPTAHNTPAAVALIALPKGIWVSLTMSTMFQLHLLKKQMRNSKEWPLEISNWERTTSCFFLILISLLSETYHVYLETMISKYFTWY